MTRRPAVPAPQPPALVRAGLLLLLPVLLALLWWDGQHFDPGLVQFTPAEKGGGGLTAKLPGRLGDVPRAGAPRLFTKDTLYEYVNGHADFYISGGFKGLATAEYGRPEKPVLVIDLFDMGTPLQAFGVLMGEAGGEPKAAPVGDLGFAATNDLRFIAGPLYVRFTVFQEGFDPLPAAQALAKALGTNGAALSFRFPAFGQEENTKFFKAAYRGMEALANVVERRFATPEGPLSAFLMSDKPEAITAAAEAVRAFLKKEDLAFTLRPDGITVVEDKYEGNWFFAAKGGRLVGGFGDLTPAREKALLEDLAK